MTSSSVQEVWDLNSWKQLEKDSNKSYNLRDLLKNNDRTKLLQLEYDNFNIDFSRQLLNSSVLNNLKQLADETNLLKKIENMFAGNVVNITEKRKVLHIALRALENDSNTNKFYKNISSEISNVQKVLNQIKIFSENVRNGKLLGYNGKKLRNVISVGIGGSYLGCEFVFEALKNTLEGETNSKDRNLRFFANIDPINFNLAVKNLDPQETLVIIISKSFGTRETLMNANIIKEWILSSYNNDNKCLPNHFIAISANKDKAVNFGINKDNIFDLWDWVGGRYSVTSAVGILPLSIHYSFATMSKFLNGCNNIDKHFVNEKNIFKNIPIMLGLIGLWNSSFLKYNTRAIIPYCQGLSRFPAHIQQLDMESNGKSVNLNGNFNNFKCGEINFGEPGTNSQHSFFQLIHQGRIIPCEFIGYCRSQLYDIYKNNNKLLNLITNNHNELMSNFFAQADALAFGKNKDEVINDNKNIEKTLINHKIFSGNRPSTLLLFKNELNPYNCGQLLAIYEHRVVTQGFIWNINSFDQWGVELGKILGKKIRNTIDNSNNDDLLKQYTQNTINNLSYYLKNSKI